VTTPDQGPRVGPGGSVPDPWQLRLLALLVAIEGGLMLLYVVLDVAFALAASDVNWGAVAILVTLLGLWGVGLLLSARGLLRHRRWAFTPAVFTQLMFGLLALEFIPAAVPAAKVVWVVILVLAVVIVVLAFSPPVRRTVSGQPRPE
jgi:hypothetical protein